MQVAIQISETGSHNNDGAIVRIPGISKTKVTLWRRVALVVAQTSAVLFLLFIALTQVYANVQVFGWSGLIALILLTPVLSLGQVWLNTKLRKVR